MKRTVKAVEQARYRLGLVATPAEKKDATYPEDQQRAADDTWRKKYSALNTKYEKALHENSVVQALVADIKEVAPKSYLDAPAIVKSGRASVSHPQSALLLFSDTHIGQIVEPEQTLGFGEYHFGMFLARLKYLEESVISILQNHVTVKTEELVVAMLGDFLHGALLHSTEADQHVTLFTQFYAGGHAIAQFLRNLAPHVPTVRIQTVVGNHTRFANQKKMPTGNRYSNLDMFTYALVQALTGDIKNIKWDLNMQPFSIFEVQGHVIKAMHGDHLRGGDKSLGIPNHAFGREVSTTTQLFAKAKKQAPHYYISGHLHRGIQLPHALGEIIVNGGFPGIDNYALAENFSPVDAMQRLMFMHPVYGRTAEFPLSLKFAKVGKTRPYIIPASFPIE